ncbi:hypothetical protein RQP46_004277 [Phenoliferia psychrophenolica]
MDDDNGDDGADGGGSGGGTSDSCGCEAETILHITSLVLTLCVAAAVAFASDSSVSDALKYSAITGLLINAAVTGWSIADSAEGLIGSLIAAGSTIMDGVCLYFWDKLSASSLFCTEIPFKWCGTYAPNLRIQFIIVTVALQIICAIMGSTAFELDAPAPTPSLFPKPITIG